MTKDRHQQISELFGAVCDLDEYARRKLLDEQCADDPELRAAVEKLIADDSDPATFLDTPALGKDFELRAGGDMSPHLKLPERIGDFAILKVIGEGGMGVVYLAEQAKTKRKVALKAIRPGVATEKMLRRFEHETEILARLHHPGIAEIYEAGTADTGFGPQPYFAMELVQGQPIIAYAQENELSTRQRLELMRKVCDAVHHAHQKGIIHRDLKPSNILVDKSGQPKILDFGVARALDANLETTTLHTDIGQLMGTVPYMSPEQAAGDADGLDTRSDVYALGVLCYQILAGRLPYDVEHKMVHEMVRVIQEEDPTPLSSINRVFRGDLDTIVAKALEKEKERRYQSASELAADINHYLHDEPVIARRAGAIHRTIKLLRRNRRALGSAVAGGSLILIISVVLAMYVFLVPVNRDKHLVNAHLVLLDPEQGDLILANLFWGDRPSEPRISRDALQTAIASYDRALRWSPFADDIRLERNIVKLAASFSDDSAIDSSLIASMKEEVPLTLQYLQSWSDDKSLPPLETLSLHAASATDLRLLGLLSYLCKDVAMATQAWSRLDLQHEPDPFIEAALGELYILTEQYPRAYPLLLSAFRTFGDVGFLCIDLANASIQLGYLDEAARLIDQAGELDRHAPYFTIKGVQADYFAAIGEDEKAIELYEFFNGLRQAPVARDHYGQFLISRGELGLATEVYMDLVRVRPNIVKYRERFVRTADRWWDSLDTSKRRQELWKMLDGGGFFITTLWRYEDSRAMLASVENVTLNQESNEARESPRRVVGNSEEPLDSLTSSFLKRATLLEIAQRIEVDNMELVAAARAYPNALKRLQIRVWESPFPRFGSKLLATIASAIRTTTSTHSRWPIVRTIDGDHPGDSLGTCRADLRESVDLNNDGYLDVLIPAIGGRNSDGLRTGYVKIVSGRYLVTEQGPQNLMTIWGDEDGDFFGHSICTAWDINADGIKDIFIGAIQRRNNGSGYVRAYCGRSLGMEHKAFILYEQRGVSSGDNFGSALAVVGDVNRDQVPDILVGASEYRTGRNGYATLLSGRFVAAGQGHQIIRTHRGEVSGALFGASLDGLSDFSSDGIGDYVIGAYQHLDSLGDGGKVYLYCGRTGDELKTLAGDSYTQRFGVHVKGAGDVDADGYPDLLIGAKGRRNNTYSRGFVRVYSGMFLAGKGGREVIYHLRGDQETDVFSNVSSIGDCDGDGYDDFMVGAYEWFRLPTGSGYLRVYSGRDHSILAEFTGASLGDRFGNWSSAIGDLDHDGVPDLIVGAMNYDGNTGNPDDNRGRAYIYLSSGPPAVSTPPNGADQVTANE